MDGMASPAGGDESWETEEEEGEELDELQQELFNHLLEHDHGSPSSDDASIASLVELDLPIEDLNHLNVSCSNAPGYNRRLYNVLCGTRLERHQALRPSWQRGLSFRPDNPALLSPVYNVNFEPTGKVAPVLRCLSSPC